MRVWAGVMRLVLLSVMLFLATSLVPFQVRFASTRREGRRGSGVVKEYRGVVLCSSSSSSNKDGDAGDKEREEKREMESLFGKMKGKRMGGGGGGSEASKLKKKKKKKLAPLTPEFSRILNVASVPDRRSVLCKLLANPSERAGLAERFDLPELSYFAANVTVKRQDQSTILVVGKLEAHIKAGEVLPPQQIFGDFDTLLLIGGGGLADSATSASSGPTFEDSTDYDDEIGANGDIDIGEIASQYLSLELFS